LLPETAPGRTAEDDDDVSTEALLRLAVQRKGLSGRAVVAGVSQLLGILDGLGGAQNGLDRESRVNNDDNLRNNGAGEEPVST
jgi:hypothetical protein